MAERVLLRVEGCGSADELRSLRQWLLEEEQLRGRVRLDGASPPPGALGTVLETLTVVLGPGGVATAVASVLISWIRRQRGNVSVKVTRPDGTTSEFSATHVSGLDASQVRQLTADLAYSLDRGGPDADPGDTGGQAAP